MFWCTADPGWVTGTSYGIISPLSNGATMIVDEADFDAPRWYGILQSERVSVWYTAPTATRMLMKAGVELTREYEFPALRERAPRRGRPPAPRARDAVSADEIRQAVLRALSEIAPEADPATLKPDVNLRDQLDIDSMDFLNFVIGIDEELGVDIPEADYSGLQTLDDFVDYLVARS